MALVGAERVVQDRPLVYQITASREPHRTIVDGDWVLLGENQVGSELGSYDRSLPLVIDPVIVYSTLVNGSISPDGSQLLCSTYIGDGGRGHEAGNAIEGRLPRAGLRWLRLSRRSFCLR